MIHGQLFYLMAYVTYAMVELILPWTMIRPANYDFVVSNPRSDNPCCYDVANYPEICPALCM